jgi:hypothetical protein
MPTTGSSCPQSGIYMGTDNCKERIALSHGERFPPCSNCRKAVNWVLVQST